MYNKPQPFIYHRRPEEPAILISRLLLHMSGSYVARMSQHLFGLPQKMNEIYGGQSDHSHLSFYHWKLTQLKHSVGTRAFTLSSPSLPLNLCFKAYIFQNLFSRQKPKSGSLYHFACMKRFLTRIFNSPQ